MEVLSTEEASLELNDKVLFEGLKRLAALSLHTTGQYPECWEGKDQERALQQQTHS